MKLWFRVAIRVLTRTLDFAWTGALTMFAVGAVSGLIVGSLHLLLSAMFSQTQGPFLVLWFGMAGICGLFGAVCGAFNYGIAGAITSRHQKAEVVIHTVNRWMFHCGIVGITGGYVNGLLYLVARQQYEGRKFPIFNLLSLNALENSSAIGFFLLTFAGTILGARKALSEMDKA